MFETVRLRTAIALPRPAAAARPAIRSIENLVLALFWLLLFEGALRKWVAPEYSRYLFFVRDPFVLLLYWRALRTNALRGAGFFLTAGVAFAAISLLLAFVQSTGFQDARFFTVMIYGWRQYFLYLPLPFVMAAALNRDSLQRFIRHAFLAVILTAPLVFAQAHSPASSVLNRGISEDENLQFKSFGLTRDTIRPAGPFTTTVGIGNLVPSSLALLLAVWLTPAGRRRIGMPMLLITAAAVATCLALSGSRGAFVHCGIVILTALLAGVVSGQAAVRGRALLIPAVLVTAGVVLYPIVFPDALSALLSRVKAANVAESQFSSLGIFGRALYETVDFVRLLGHTPVTGYGLGLGGNGRSFLGEDGVDFMSDVYVESEWSRHIVDLGTLVGVLFILYRIAFSIDVFKQALRATRRSGDPMPLLLFGYVGIGLFYGQLTGHGTVGGFLWLYLGLCLASCRAAQRPAAGRPASRPGVPP